MIDLTRIYNNGKGVILAIRLLYSEYTQIECHQRATVEHVSLNNIKQPNSRKDTRPPKQL
jgi:hypothetical protein